MSKKQAIHIQLLILGAALIFHTLIIIELIPFDKVWAGKLKSVEEMRSFETVSTLINLFIITVLIIKEKHLAKNKENVIITVLLWIFCALFALNTVGNLFAENIYELIFGTLLTLTSSILYFIIAKKPKRRTE